MSFVLVFVDSQINLVHDNEGLLLSCNNLENAITMEHCIPLTGEGETNCATEFTESHEEDFGTESFPSSREKVKAMKSRKRSFLKGRYEASKGIDSDSGSDDEDEILEDDSVEDVEAMVGVEEEMPGEDEEDSEIPHMFPWTWKSCPSDTNLEEYLAKPTSELFSGVKPMIQNRLKNLTFHGIFSLLMPITFFQRLVEETNDYAGRHPNNKFKMTLTEMVVFHGMCLTMALYPLPKLRQYWSTSSVGPLPPPRFGEFGLSRERFKLIRRFFHIVSNQGRDVYPTESREYKLWQMYPVMNLFKETFKKYYVPNSVLTIDERTIPTRNRMCPIRVYNPSKPYKFGIEVFSMCDSFTYYCYDFIVYDRVKQEKMHQKMVLHLVDTLPTDRKFSFVLDRGFTSPELLQKLAEKGHGATGTVVTNRIHFPKDLVNLPNKVQAGTWKGAVCENPFMVAISWMDRKPVNLLSTNCGLLETSIIRRRGNTTISIPAPQAVKFYNANKDAVDQF
jgi:Transposase IS4